MVRIDLYALLRDYAAGTKSSSFSIAKFLSNVEKHAVKRAPFEEGWDKWAENAKLLFSNEISALVDEGKCILLASGTDGRIFIPAYCSDKIRDAYSDPDKLADSPFPNEKSLGLEMPQNYARNIILGLDMGLFFERHDNTPDPSDVIMLQFPQGYGNAILLGSMIPRKLMEVSLIKIRNYLHKGNNKDFVLNKMIAQMKGKEKSLKDIIDRIIVRPLDCLQEMEGSADFPYLFWTYFCPFVKTTITKESKLLEDDIAALQAISVVEVCYTLYRNKASQKRDVDAAFMTLEVRMDSPPYLYSLDDIINFTNDRGVRLLDIYSAGDLDDYIEKAVSDNIENALPPWLVVPDDKQGDRRFVKKERYLPLCSKMIISAQVPVKNAIIRRWSSLIKEYESEPAMKNDAEFEKLLAKLTKDLNPGLKAMLEDTKLYLSYLELERVPGAITQSARIFKGGSLLSYSSLYALRRKDLIFDVKLRFPFWHSIPILVAFIVFLRKLRGKKKDNNKVKKTSISTVGQETSDLQRSARMIELAIVPSGKTIEEYLTELEGKWALLLDKKARANLIADVQSLLRENLRGALKVYKLKRISREGLREMATIMLRRNPGLKNISEQGYLRMYMELYMLKLMLGGR